MTNEPTRMTRIPALKPALAAIAGVFLVAVVTLVARGTWADDAPVDPKTSAEGTITRLYRSPDGRTQVRCSAVVDAPAERVWSVVTDYEHFPEIFGSVSTLGSLEVTRVDREPDGGVRMVGRVTSRLGTWPVDARVRHETSTERRIASWDEEGDGHVNRGSWTIAPLGPDRSLVVYQLEVHERPYPRALVNNVLLGELAPVVEAVRADLATRR